MVTFGEGHMHCKLLMAKVGKAIIYTQNTPSKHDSYNIYANWTTFLAKWCICDIYNLRQHWVMAAISVYIQCKLQITLEAIQINNVQALGTPWWISTWHYIKFRAIAMI